MMMMMMMEEENNLYRGFSSLEMVLRGVMALLMVVGVRGSITDTSWLPTLRFGECWGRSPWMGVPFHRLV